MIATIEFEQSAEKGLWPQSTSKPQLLNAGLPFPTRTAGPNKEAHARQETAITRTKMAKERVRP